ncbi:MAG: DNA-3-methyladenine glycosylase I [Hydrogenophilales bacterium CG_4_9_14_3_um_filter_63_34]|nr:MAG: DNA-3-methyladenine glycosylase I [Hydrogenophilales bacterium CG_4_10_14_3_um_filter_63_21]PJB02088.1 MAG: DNA-3-methyladenine glycosylase I [Hydrogenophilales bacterium CG_4_9_14_3_um_filter_63_34]
MAELQRCPWPGSDPLYQRYHDEEWGVPLRDERALFELLLLEGMQAGLSWITLLRRREGLRLAFDGFDPARIATYDSDRVAALLADSRIIRNRAKVAAAIANARAFLAVKARGGDFSELIWAVVNGQPRQNHWRAMAEVPAATEDSQRLSQCLLQRGFKFVGPTICYAFMQSAGLVNDHLLSCPRHGEVMRLA